MGGMLKIWHRFSFRAEVVQESVFGTALGCRFEVAEVVGLGCQGLRAFGLGFGLLGFRLWGVQLVCKKGLTTARSPDAKRVCDCFGSWALGLGLSRIRAQGCRIAWRNAQTGGEKPSPCTDWPHLLPGLGSCRVKCSV